MGNNELTSGRVCSIDRRTVISTNDGEIFLIHMRDVERLKLKSDGDSKATGVVFRYKTPYQGLTGYIYPGTAELIMEEENYCPTRQELLDLYSKAVAQNNQSCAEKIKHMGLQLRQIYNQEQGQNAKTPPCEYAHTSVALTVSEFQAIKEALEIPKQSAKLV